MFKFIKELRKKTLPKDKNDEVKKDFLAYYVIRPLGDCCTLPFIKLGISATTVTKISGIFVILAFIFFMINNVWLGFLFLFIWDVLDAVDGNIARFTDTTSNLGRTMGCYGRMDCCYSFFCRNGNDSL